MKKLFLLLLTPLLILNSSCGSADGPYDEKADAKADIHQALLKAARLKKPTIIVFGANWCPDCRALSEAMEKGESASQIANDFITVKVNVGNFDTNLDITANYGNPIQGGIPGAALLSPDGTLVYTTKPGEMATVRQQGGDKLYQFFKQHSG